MERFEKYRLPASCTARAMGDSAYDDDHVRPREARARSPGCSGQCFVIAWNTIRLNREATETVAERLIEVRELYGDDVVELLDERAPAQARDRRPGREHMARDLIPPPSPAGRPQPEGTPRLVELPPEPAPVIEEPPARAGPAAAVALPQPLRLPDGRARGRAVVAAAVVLAIVLATGNGDVDEGLAPNWSKWQPTDTSLEGGAARDRRAGRRQVQARRPASSSCSSPAARCRTGSGSPCAPAGSRVLDGDGVLYQLNGLGPNGSIAARRAVGRAAARSCSARRSSSRSTRSATCPTSRWCVVLLPPPPPKATPTATPPRLAAAAPHAGAATRRSRSSTAPATSAAAAGAARQHRAGRCADAGDARSPPRARRSTR